MTPFQTIALLALFSFMLFAIVFWRLALLLLRQVEGLIGGKVGGATAAKSGATPLLSVSEAAIAEKTGMVEKMVLGMLQRLGFLGRIAGGVMRRRKEQMLAGVRARCEGRGLREISEHDLFAMALQVVLSTVVRGIRRRCHLLLAIAEVVLAAGLAAVLLWAK